MRRRTETRWPRLKSPGTILPGRIALRKRPHRRRMGLDRSVHALAAASRQAANGGSAKDCGCHLLHAVDRLPVAEAAQRSACGAGGMPPEVADPEGIRAVYHRTGVLLPLLSRRHPRSAQSRPGHAGAGNGRTRGVSHSRCDRQPVGQDHRSRGPARVRCRKEDQGTQAPHHHRI